ncbi:MAG: hypothetical protein COA99_08565 [Moraxellaceae bacterium]|nr:MAG: hypothetical protein COA99_08565 [Moraxellaceae bacterium]
MVASSDDGKIYLSGIFGALSNNEMDVEKSLIQLSRNIGTGKLTYVSRAIFNANGLTSSLVIRDGC